MEGPYRDLGSGFARLGGSEGLRRAPSRISSVEDALLELLRNSYEAGADNIYVASTLSKRRYRTLIVLDDGAGIPETHKDLIFEPGVTSHHISREPHLKYDLDPPRSSGLSLYHIRQSAENATVCSISNPTSIKTTFDTEKIPENTLQSSSRASKSNLEAVARNVLYQVLKDHPKIKIYLSSPARILAALLEYRIIQMNDTENLLRQCANLGFVVSERTLQRIKRRDVQPADPISTPGSTPGKTVATSGTTLSDLGGVRHHLAGSGSITLDIEERAEISAVLSKAARKSYLEVGEMEVESGPGRIRLSARLYEPEDEYE